MTVTLRHIHTHDFDEFLAWEHALGFDSEQIQLTRGRGAIEAAITSLGEWSMLRYRSAEQMLCEYAIPDGMVEFCISHYSTPLVWCGREMSGTSVVIHRDRRRYRAVLPPGGITYGCMLPVESALQLGLITDRDLQRRDWAAKAETLADESSALRLFSALHCLLDAQVGSAALDQTAQGNDAIVSAWQEVLDAYSFPDDTQRHPTPSKALIDSAQDFISSRSNESLTSEQLSFELGVSRRSLERAFRHGLGVSPYQYLLIRRLHMARRMLKEGQHSILATCSQCGFAHPSRFAELYARQFGELPSQTKDGGEWNHLSKMKF